MNEWNNMNVLIDGEDRKLLRCNDWKQEFAE